MGDTASNYERVHAILAEARHLNGHALTTFLSRACDGDSSLRAHVEELLEAGRDDDDAFADDNIEGARRVLDAALDEIGTPWMPDVIGAYKVVRPIGRGGMGVVYEAVQRSPRRRVAIKLLNSVHSGGEGLRRFQREAALLGHLRHPGIAQIIEASTFDAGHGRQPFFAMEFVDGLPLVAYAEENDLDLAQRLEMIAETCDILEYAHQQGVVHRDLKSDNILVVSSSTSSSESRDALVARPKVLDFGIARATDLDLGDTTLHTVEGQIVGTVSSMSPEQASGARDAIDGRSDVYSLGVLTYQLLAGKLPLSVDGMSIQEALHVICEDEPPLLGLVDRAYRGDIETIVAKTLEKEREQRYPSAAAFGADIRRFLRDVPVVARPPSLIYKCRKYMRRNKAMLAGVFATITLAVAAFVISTTIGDDKSSRAAQRLEELELTTDEQLAELRRLADSVLVNDLKDEAMQLWPQRPAMIPRYRDWLGRTTSVLARQQDHEDSVDRVREEARLKQEIAAQGELTGTAPGDAELRWRLETFTQLLTDIGKLKTVRDHVAQRLAYAQSVETLTRTGREPAAAWREALAAISAMDVYEGVELAEQLTLLPLGPDPASGLWEFADTQTGSAPTRDEHGGLVLTGSTGVVFVLMPGGTFNMGAQRENPDLPNYDPLASPDEGPVHEVTLSPFFMSKYEMTQGQWKHVTGENSSSYGVDGHWSTDWNAAGQEASYLLPVEWVDWFQCHELMNQLAWTLPSEAQWEYAARAGTTTPWWTGAKRESLAGAVNLLDSFAIHVDPDHAVPEDVDAWMNDGYAVHAPVHHLRPNAFGLHHMLGNVWEWCRDHFDSNAYKTSAALDPVTLIEDDSRRVNRGGAFNDDSRLARVSYRDSFSPVAVDHNLGLRPARAID